MKITIVLLILLTLISCKEDKTSKDLETSKDHVIEDQNPLPTQIEIFGEQFKWTVRYSGKDNKLGKFDYKLMSETNPLGIMTIDAIETSLLDMQYGENGVLALSEKLKAPPELLSSKDRDELEREISKKEKFIRLLDQMRKKHDKRIDLLALDDFILSDTLVLCKNEAYDFRFRSKDVIHSAYFPELRAQMNTVPGMETRFKFTPDTSTEEMRLIKKDPQFEYTLMCNKICGAGHYSMKMPVRVLEKKEYDMWMKSKSSKSFKSTIFALRYKKERLLKDNNVTPQF